MAAYASAEQAWALKVAGKSLSEIAQELGIPNQWDVSRLLSERMGYEAAFLTDTERKSLLALSVARLEALLSACWPSAMMGDPKSIHEAGELVMKEAKITGIEQVDPVVNKNLVLVMGEKEDEYIKALRAATEE